MTPDTLSHILDQSGTLGALIVALVAFWRGWVVRGSEFDRMTAERDAARAEAQRWQDAAFRSLQLGERISGVLERAGPQ